MNESHKLQEGYEPSSLDVAALILSDGQTTDPALAVKISEGVDLDFDALTRANLRRHMGFDFTFERTSLKRAIVTSTEGPIVSAVAKFTDKEVLDTDAMTHKVVDACLNLKDKWDTAVEELEKEQDDDRQ